jgi:uncharacterized protein YbaR (Trm112 family)
MQEWDCGCGTRNAPESLECQGCGRPQALVSGAGGVQPAAARICPRCQHAWPATAAFCRHCGHLFPLRDDLPGMPFTPCSETEIRAEATRALVREPKWGMPTAQIGGAFVLACLSLRIPGIGVLTFFAGSLVALWMMLRLWGVLAAARIPDEELAERAQEWRRMCRGECPLCGQGVRVIPYSDQADFLCPACHGPLHYEEGYVSAREKRDEGRPFGGG